MGDQFAVGDEHDPGEQRQHVGQRLRVAPMSGRNNRYVNDKTSRLARVSAAPLPIALQRKLLPFEDQGSGR